MQTWVGFKISRAAYFDPHPLSLSVVIRFCQTKLYSYLTIQPKISQHFTGKKALLSLKFQNADLGEA